MNAGQCEKQPLRAIISLREQRRARLCDSRFVVVEIKMGNWNLDFFLLFFPFRWKKNCVIILSSKFSNENVRPFLLPGIRNFDLEFFARWELYRDKYIYMYIFFEQVFNTKKSSITCTYHDVNANFEKFRLFQVSSHEKLTLQLE